MDKKAIKITDDFVSENKFQYLFNSFPLFFPSGVIKNKSSLV